MAYTKTIWVDGQSPAVNAANLNHIEEGIKYANQEVDYNTGDIGTLYGTKQDTLTGSEFKTVDGQPIMGTGDLLTGSVLQTVGMVSTQQGSQSVTTTGLQLQNISQAITPVGTNSKFLISVRWFGEGDNSWDWGFNIKAGTTSINVPTNGFLAMPNQSFIDDDDGSTPETVGISTLYQPTTAAAGTPITFSLWARAHTGTWTVWTNRCFSAGSEIGSSEIIIQELKA